MNILPEIGNVGIGAGQIFKSKTQQNLNQLRSIVAGSGISVVNNANEIEIAATGGAGATNLLETHWVSGPRWYADRTNGAINEIIYTDAQSNMFQASRFNPGVDSFSWADLVLSSKAPPNSEDFLAEVSIYWTSGWDNVNNVRWEISHRLVRDTETLDDTLTASVVLDANIGDWNRLYIAPVTFAFSGTYGPGAMAIIKVGRTGTNVADTVPDPVWLLGVRYQLKALLS